MSKSFRRLLTVTVTAALLFGTTAAALAEEPTTDRDLNQYLCKDVMRLSGSEREVSLALVHGYRLGKMGTTEFDVEVLSDLTDRFIDYCLDNPTDNALAAFEKLAK
ncbi:HdeA/HdeB family chaperone [uncultured Thiohalocapsa sp.]|uniref:HdeA/HdeB family chaperone n=1 Tax=uncultured Thiohalocapsa sp. TaxID=768990 RepID=UPI0025FC4A72|nr:HdeA/HdeB family chaperone [uncultured Thiohalocapsa sp.]